MTGVPGFGGAESELDLLCVLSASADADGGLNKMPLSRKHGLGYECHSGA